MKEEALKLADELQDYMTSLGWKTHQAPDMIRRLVEELDKQTKPTITKLDGKVVAVTMTDDEHRITEVLWEAPKPLSDDEIHDIWKSLWEGGNIGHIAYNYTKAIEERHGIK